MDALSFKLNAGELILFQNQPFRKWYQLVWRIGVSLFEVTLFIIFSSTAFTSLAMYLLSSFLPTGLSDMLSRIIFQGILPALLVVWFAGETIRIFTSRLLLTTQRILIKGSPYPWIPQKEMPLNEIQSMYARRDALFIRLNQTKKIQVHLFQDADLVVEAFAQYTGKSGAK